MPSTTRDDMVDCLLRMSFRPYATVSAKWRHALHHWNGEKSLFVLVRKNGVDLLETPLKSEELMRSDGCLSVSMRRNGDRVAEYFYADNQLPIHDLVLEAATLFCQKKEIDSQFFQKMGVGKTELIHRIKSQRECDLSELYQELADDVGEDVYLSDGVWLSADGGMSER